MGEMNASKKPDKPATTVNVEFSVATFDVFRGIEKDIEQILHRKVGHDKTLQIIIATKRIEEALADIMLDLDLKSWRKIGKKDVEE